ncbi:hypothetical protein RRG08_026671 [Elysia crispata]|uniref:Uncharacterized protein n=1 Tax=Elysia crispata TaxID=231223 RepID=A0AAE1B009_9GAST|nr:hypothetical protein RRG08_026671 [Elysia crispata]
MKRSEREIGLYSLLKYFKTCAKMANCGWLWSIIWLIILILFGWPIGFLCAVFFVLLSPCAACCGGCVELINLLERGVKLPLTCAQNMSNTCIRFGTCSSCTVSPTKGDKAVTQGRDEWRTVPHKECHHVCELRSTQLRGVQSLITVDESVINQLVVMVQQHFTENSLSSFDDLSSMTLLRFNGVTITAPSPCILEDFTTDGLQYVLINSTVQISSHTLHRSLSAS